MGDVTFIDASYNQIQVLRKELDAKLMELYAVDNSVYTENKLAYDTTIYTGLLFTVLATSILYFTFTKLWHLCIITPLRI